MQEAENHSPIISRKKNNFSKIHLSFLAVLINLIKACSGQDKSFVSSASSKSDHVDSSAIKVSSNAPPPGGGGAVEPKTAMLLSNNTTMGYASPASQKYTPIQKSVGSTEGKSKHSSFVSSILSSPVIVPNSPIIASKIPLIVKIEDSAFKPKALFVTPKKKSGKSEDLPSLIMRINKTHKPDIKLFTSFSETPEENKKNKSKDQGLDHNWGKKDLKNPIDSLQSSDKDVNKMMAKLLYSNCQAKDSSTLDTIKETLSSLISDEQAKAVVNFVPSQDQYKYSTLATVIINKNQPVLEVLMTVKELDVNLIGSKEGLSPIILALITQNFDALVQLLKSSIEDRYTLDVNVAVNFQGTQYSLLKLIQSLTVDDIQSFNPSIELDYDSLLHKIRYCALLSDKDCYRLMLLQLSIIRQFSIINILENVGVDFLRGVYKTNDSSQGSVEFGKFLKEMTTKEILKDFLKKPLREFINNQKTLANIFQNIQTTEDVPNEMAKLTQSFLNELESELQGMEELEENSDDDMKANLKEKVLDSVKEYFFLLLIVAGVEDNNEDNTDHDSLFLMVSDKDEVIKKAFQEEIKLWFFNKNVNEFSEAEIILKGLVRGEHFFDNKLIILPEIMYIDNLINYSNIYPSRINHCIKILTEAIDLFQDSLKEFIKKDNDYNDKLELLKNFAIEKVDSKKIELECKKQGKIFNEIKLANDVLTNRPYLTEYNKEAISKVLDFGNISELANEDLQSLEELEEYNLQVISKVLEIKKNAKQSLNDWVDVLIKKFGTANALDSSSNEKITLPFLEGLSGAYNEYIVLKKLNNELNIHTICGWLNDVNLDDEESFEQLKSLNVIEEGEGVEYLYPERFKYILRINSKDNKFDVGNDVGNLKTLINSKELFLIQDLEEYLQDRAMECSDEDHSVDSLDTTDLSGEVKDTDSDNS